MKTVKRDEALSAARKIRTLGLTRVAGSSGSGALLVVTEEGEVISISGVTEIRVTDGKLTDNGGSSISLDLTGDGVSVAGETDPVITSVKSFIFPDGIVTDNGGGEVFVDTRNVLSVAEPGDDPRVYRVTEIRVPDGTLTDLGDGNVELAFAAPLTVTEEDDSPSVTPVTQIRVPSGSLIDNGSGSVSLDLLGLSTWGAYISFLARLVACRGAWGMSPIDSSGNTYDASGLGKTLSPITTVEYAGGIIRDAYPITAANGEFERSSEADNQITGTESFINSAWKGLTIVVWGISTSSGAAQGLLGKWNTSGNQRSYLLEKTAAPSYKFSISDNGTTVFSVTSSVTPSVSDDVFFAASFLPSTSIDIWVGTMDGVLTHDTFTTSIPSGIHSGSANLQLGAYNAGSNTLSGVLFGAGLYAACLNIGNTIETIYNYGRKTIPLPTT